MIKHLKNFFVSEINETQNTINKNIDPSIDESIFETHFNEGELVAIPPKLRSEGYYSFLSEMSLDLTYENEAKREFVANNIMVGIAASIPSAYFIMPFAASHTVIRLFSLQVLPSGCGKGVSDKQTKALFNEAIQLLGDNIKSPQSGLPLYARFFSGGLSTGEGIAYELRDGANNDDGEIQQGVEDKRLLVLEPEFFNVLVKCLGPNSILSSSIRKIFDGDSLEPMTKKDRIRCTNPDICILGQITPEELVAKLDSVSISNGFANRFPVFSGTPPIYQPIPKVTEKELIKKHAKKLNEIMFWCHESPKVLTMSDCYEKLWREKYSDLKQIGASGSIEQSLMTRVPHYATMFAMLFAALDMTTTVTANHLAASLAWIDYWHESVRYVFGTEAAAYKAEQKNLQALEVLNKIKELVALNNGQPITRTPLQQSFGKKYTSKQLSDVLKFLQELPKAPIAVTKHPHNKQLISLT
ncbi:DUF3987 domain-containing protein [Photobacterium leiognathi]|uniref:DUF3987 domain-containing protein n=1 Tax=Photobacterium leiognathi TaxID=553611 RepID=UPI0029815FEA|nr:DUF3987 domain-containing protein [Photobacterium leiognathi]